MSERESRDMSTGSFVSLILILLLIVFVAVMVRSQLKDLQRRVGELEQRK